jgi:stage III sporulation protein AH
MANRQTVWLSTMMILSLMVIGYYTVDDTLKPVPTATEGSKKSEQQDQKKEQDKSADKQSAKASDWFEEQFMQKEVNYSKKMEELQHVIGDAKTSSDDKIKAEQELNTMKDFYEKANNAEEKVVQEGFPDALITKDNGRVLVTVQASQLSKDQAAKIYLIVSKEMNIPASQIVVSYKQ